MIRVVLVDDHPTVRTGIRVLLNAEPDVQVVAEVGDGMEALAVVRKFEPDVVVMDISIPSMNGIEATKVIRAEHASVRVLGFSAHEELAFARVLLDAGATGYALKQGHCEELIRAVRVVAGGGTYLDPALAGKLVRSSLRRQPPETLEPCRLSERETEVLRLIAEGQTIKEIADRLQLGARTVETYRARAMEKLSLKTRVDLIRYAVRSDWLRGL